MKRFSISGRCLAAPPPADWRAQLAQMLGAKPRRLGSWAELGLYGALRCMADADETTLPPGALLLLTSRRGSMAATRNALEQLHDGLLMPLAFLQTQSSQLLATLAAQLSWQGHGCFFACAPAQDLLRLAAVQAGDAGALLGWVDEMDETEGGATNWLRIQRGAAGKHGFVATCAEAMRSPGFSRAD
jgi:hypothetical protein